MPKAGAEVYASGGRAHTTARVMPTGAIRVRHVYPPYAMFEIEAKRGVDLLDVPADFVRELAVAVGCGAVWNGVRDALKRR